MDVPGLDVAEIAKSFAKGVVKDMYAYRRREAEVPDPGDPIQLLCACHERPSNGSVANDRNEIAPPHGRPLGADSVAKLGEVSLARNIRIGMGGCLNQRCALNG